MATRTLEHGKLNCSIKSVVGIWYEYYNMYLMVMLMVRNVRKHSQIRNFDCTCGQYFQRLCSFTDSEHKFKCQLGVTLLHVSCFFCALRIRIPKLNGSNELLSLRQLWSIILHRGGEDLLIKQRP